MGPFGIPWNIAFVYILGFIATPVVAEVVIHSKWWKEKSDYYYSFNQEEEK